MSKKKCLFFLGLFDKILNQEDYFQILGPHTKKSILLSHLPQKPTPFRKKTYKNFIVIFDMLMPTSCSLIINLTKIPKVPPKHKFKMKQEP
jgi:hypothetical protein